jgi:signal transduction histidine kinase
MARLLRPLATPDTFRAVLFYLAELVLGVGGWILLIAGWCITVCFAITPLVVPLLIGLGVAVGMLAQAHAASARGLLGVTVRPSLAGGGAGLWQRAFSVLGDRAFWRQQAYLLLAWPVAFVALLPLYWALELLSLPVTYRWLGSDDVIGLFEIDSSVEALPFAAIGLGLLVAAAHVFGVFARLSGRLATRLLAREGERVVRSAAEIRAGRRRALTVQALVSATIAVALVVTWAFTTAGYFWPMWPILSLALVLAIPGWIVLVLERRELVRLALGSRALAIQIGISAFVLAFLVAVWAITTRGYFWPIWCALGLGVAAAVHAAVVYGRRKHRIERLEETRAGAVDVQESELRRIERDLHDGAQARLVALGMSLGRAEQALDTDPQAVRQLLSEARRGAGEALTELRDLARGIRPPILTDRGLEPAVSALVARTPLPVTLSVDIHRRYPSAVETAAYFTVAEALANAIKHANAERVDIRIQAEDRALVAEVLDDGDGGADPFGPGLTGLRQRAEALDGTLRVASPPGGPTTVRVELPCES